MRLRLAVAAISLIQLSSSAFGQAQIGETGALPIRTFPQPARVEGEGVPAARVTTHQLGICVVKKFRARARQIVDVPVDDPAFRKDLTGLATSDCLRNGDLSVPPLILRGAIFEALYSADFRRGFAADFSKVAPLDYASKYKRPFSALAATAVGLATVADCAARSDPAAARLMIESAPNSAEEDRALGVMAAKLRTCIPNGLSFRFSRSMIRASLAEAVYRLTQQSSAVQSAAGGSR